MEALPGAPSAEPGASAPSPTVLLKLQLLRAACATDRGQLLNELVWGDAYGAEREKLRSCVARLEAAAPPFRPALLDGDWELVATDGAQLFRSSPFFLAVGEALGPSGAALFFRLHELQVASFGLSRYGAVTQSVDTASGRLTSSFVTLLFGLTVLPIIGWWKLLPTFGGRVVSVATGLATDGTTRELRFELDTTTVEEAPGVPLLPLVGRFLVNRTTPVGAVWRLLPWNGGRPPTCRLRCTYLDDTLRVMRDTDGAAFIYARC